MPEDSFYYYGLWTTGAIHRPAPTACSIEGLATVTSQYCANGSSPSDVGLKWAESDSPYDLFGDEYFVEVEALFDELGNPYDRPLEVTKALLECIIQALGDLDREGFFGIGAARDKVVINVTMPGEEEEASVLARARKLNPASALREYEKDLLDIPH